MKIIFFGSDDFASAHLKALLDSAHKVAACVTQPDKPKGRGMTMIVSPVKECAFWNNIPVLQPVIFKDRTVVKQLKGFESDLFVVIAYGKFLPKDVLAIPSKGAVNVHGSLLPKYRGAAPINWAVIKGEEETGISITQINEVMDGGDILAQEKIAVTAEDTALTLRAKMMQAGPSLLLKTIDSMDRGTARRAPAVQDENLATFAPKLTKEMGHIRWDKGAEEIHNRVRGLQPWPGAYTFYQGKLLKILATAVTGEDSPAGQAGQILKIDKSGLTVATATKNLLIKKVHLQASKPMDAHAFAIGHQIDAGFKFG